MLCVLGLKSLTVWGSVSLAMKPEGYFVGILTTV